MNTQMLHLARKSRDVYNAKIHYQRLRMQELQMVQGILVDELEASQGCLDMMERQIGEIRTQVYPSGGIANTSTSTSRELGWSCLLNRVSSRTSSPCGNNLSSRGSDFRRNHIVPPSSSNSPVLSTN